MKIYTFNFDGFPLGGEAVVIAPNEKRAKEILIHEYSTHFSIYDEKSIDLLCEPILMPKNSKVIYFDDGDY